MPLFTRTFQIVAGLLSIPIVGTAVIGVNYASPFLTHLVDITNGSLTVTDMESNAPNWGYAVQLPQVQGIAAATTTSGTLASSTAYSFAVAALDQLGTTTVSTISPASTDASTSGLGAESLQVTWAAVPGAQRYAIFFATGTASTASGLTQYFIATTTSAYTFATSTGSISGSYTKTDTTAFADLLQPNGPSYIEGDNGTATGSPVAASGTALEINGGLRATEVGTTTSCDAQTAGTIIFNTSNSHLAGCNGTKWVIIF
jgi:hypothetical protein